MSGTPEIENSPLRAAIGQHPSNWRRAYALKPGRQAVDGASRGRLAGRLAGLGVPPIAAGWAALFAAFALTPAIARADPLASPSMTAPLSANPNPMSFDGGALGKIYISGQVSGLFLSQTNRASSPYPGDASTNVDLSNAQVEAQTTSGPLQVFVEVGDYSLPALGTPYIRAGRSLRVDYTGAPVAYLKLVPCPDVSIQAGALPTLIGAESTFTFQNMNIERGLLWNQEPAVSRGVQVNYSHGPVLMSASVNDGFYSGRLTWISALASYALDPDNTLVVDGGASLQSDAAQSVSTPLAQNNSRILDLMYTFSKGPVLVNPYLQLTSVEARPGAGLATSASTLSGAVLVKWSFTPAFSIAARGELIRAGSGGCSQESACPQTDLLYGPQSRASSMTLTPTYQKGLFFLRGEISDTGVSRTAPGLAFGASGAAKTQARGLIETGVIF